MFWATKHFSQLIARGARRVLSSGSYENQIAFQNPDGSVVVELLNESVAPLSLTIAVGARSQQVNLPPQSFATLLLSRS